MNVVPFRSSLSAAALLLSAGLALAQPCNFANPPAQTDAPDNVIGGFVDSNGDGIDGMACGPIFVDTVTGSDANPGTITAPMKSLGAAMLAAHQLTPKRDVYISVGTYIERLCLVPGINVYGGYNAATGWSRSLSNIAIIRSTSTVPAAWIADSGIVGASNFAFVQFDTSPIATAYPFNAALIAQNSTNAFSFFECRFSVGSAASGTAGVPGAPGTAGSAGAAGQNGSCDSIVVANGGAGGASPAGFPGGAGGRGGQGNQNGLAGSAAPGGGFGGTGGPWGDPGTAGSTGQTGAAGTNGTNGTAGSGVGLFGAGVSAGSGTVGIDGRGGGGGGGGGGQDCTFCNDGTGNGGSGGGGGGEGGTAGTGGTGGGSTFALLANASSNLSLASCWFTAGNAGSGGAGGAGGNGGSGGAGGSQVIFCNSEVGRGGAGGAGGAGGRGGHGGGGAGGSVAGVALAAGASVSNTSPVIQSFGSAGTGGTSPANIGANGVVRTTTPLVLSSLSYSVPTSPVLHAHLRLFGAINSPTPPQRIWLNRPTGSTQFTSGGGSSTLTFGSSPDGVASADASANVSFTPNSGFSGFTSFTFSSSTGFSGAAVVFIAPAADCNGNGIDDAIDISGGASQDCDANAIPDECLTPNSTVITTHPANISPAINSSGMLAVAASGPGTITYQWKKGATSVVNDARISGATSSVLTINPVITADAGTYTCVVTSSCATITSNSATLSPICKPDYNADGMVSVQDLFDFLAGWFQGCP